MFQKNHEFLIDVFAEAYKKNPHMALLLVGDGPLRPAMEEKVRKLGLTGHVKFLGLRNNVQDFYHVMDLFILPYHYEGLPVVGVEAKANGLLCLFSTKVTKETRLTHSAQFLDLEAGASMWAEGIISLKCERNKKAGDELRQAGFEINKETEKLVKFYIELSTGDMMR